MSADAPLVGARPASEMAGVAGWTAAAIAMVFLPGVVDTPQVPSAPFILLCIGFAFWNACQVVRAWRWRARLVGQPVWRLPCAQVESVARASPDFQWLGRGFDWTPVHAQRMHMLLACDPRLFAPSRWLSRIIQSDPPTSTGASQPRLICGVEAQPKPLYLPLAALASHTLVFGQTGTGKTRLAELILASFLARHPQAAVFMLDPKGDRALRATLETACRRAGRADDFLWLHPAFPAQSIRFDPLRNFSRTTSIATRIASLLPASAGGDAFTQFAWRALHRVADAMVYAGVRPSLAGLRRCLEDDAQPLLARCLDRWRAGMAATATTATTATAAPTAPAHRAAHATAPPAASRRNARAPTLAPRLAAALARYREHVLAVPDSRAVEIDGLLSLILHDPTHYSKMIQNLLPLLSALTAGELGPLLSPELGAPDDHRPAFDARKVIEQRRCLYIGLDSLTDATVGAAIGAMVLADLAQVAGELFNRGEGPPVPVLVFVDEAAEVVNAPLIQLLNKSRGAGFTLYLAAQTVHDYEARLGGAAAARMLLGNPGNLIALRTADPETQRFCTEGLAPTDLETLGESRAVGLRGSEYGSGLSAAIGQRRERREAELFAPGWLSLLPDLHFFARIAGGRTIKGELPLLIDPATE